MGNKASAPQGGDQANAGHTKSKVQAVTAIASASQKTGETPGASSAATPNKALDKKTLTQQQQPTPPKPTAPKPDPEKQKAEMEKRRIEEEKRHQEQLEQYKRRQQEQVARQNEQRRQAALNKKKKEEADRREKYEREQALRREEQERLLHQKEEVLRAQQDWEQGQKNTGYSTYSDTPSKNERAMLRHQGFDNDKFRQYNNGTIGSNQSPSSQAVSSPFTQNMVSPDRTTNQLTPGRNQMLHNHFPDSPARGSPISHQHFTPQKSESPVPQAQFDDLEENLMDEILSDLES